MNATCGAILFVFALTWAPQRVAHGPVIVKRSPEILYETPSEFQERNLPYIKLSGSIGGKRFEGMFSLDSGCNQSVLFGQLAPDKAALRPASLSASPQVSLGKLAFAVADESQFLPTFQRLYNSMKAIGILGFDFFVSHDVLIDYERHKIYCSKGVVESRDGGEEDPVFFTEDLNGARKSVDLSNSKLIPVSEFPSGYCAVVITSRNPTNIAFMIVDTGAEMPSLPSAWVFHQRPPDAPSVTINGPLLDRNCWRESMIFGLCTTRVPQPSDAVSDKPIELKTDVAVGENAQPVLSPQSLGGQFLFAFRRSMLLFL